MPIEGWDHVELWVGNAKQSAYFYEHALGFTPVAYAGPETGVRDRASYVLEQGHIRLVVTSGLRADSEVTRFCPRARRRREGRRADRPERDRGVPAGGATRRRVREGAPLGRGRARPGRARHDRDVRRDGAHVRQPLRVRRPVPARLRASRRQRRSGQGRRATGDRPRGRQRRARPDEPLGRVLREDDGHDGDAPLLRRGHLHGVLGADVEGDDGRPRQDQVPDQRARRGSS